MSGTPTRTTAIYGRFNMCHQPPDREVWLVVLEGVLPVVRPPFELFPPDPPPNTYVLVDAHSGAAFLVFPLIGPVGCEGDGTITPRTTPVQVSGLNGVIAITARLHHSLALRSDGTVWAWGDNAYGQLGDGTTRNRSMPVQVSGLSGVIAVSAGGSRSLALRSDGTVWAWGYNSSGQLGDGTTTHRSMPVQVSGLSGVIAFAAGGEHSLALSSDGSVWAWGNNSSGQLIDGTTTQRSTPARSGLSPAVGIAAGYDYSLARRAP